MGEVFEAEQRSLGRRVAVKLLAPDLLLDAARDVHVGDFGLAVALRGAEPSVERGQALLGTLRYMAPERLAHGVSTFATDQYALGVTLYELIAKRPPWDERDPAALSRLICQGPRPRSDAPTRTSPLSSARPWPSTPRPATGTWTRSRRICAGSWAASPSSRTLPRGAPYARDARRTP